jgi:hypothetical protein
MRGQTLRYTKKVGDDVPRAEASTEEKASAAGTRPKFFLIRAIFLPSLIYYYQMGRTRQKRWGGDVPNQ